MNLGNGRAVNYDLKFHPMDVVTRPNSAAVSRHCKSVSFADSEDDEQISLPSSPESSSSDTSVSQDSPLSNAPRQRITLTPRTPDPRAVRHSSRKAARKPVIYSSKHHPQDYGLPGYRHRAIIIEDDDEQAIDRDARAQASQKRDNDDSNDQAQSAPRQARKKLRTINRTEALLKAKRGRGRPRKNSASGIRESEDLANNTAIASLAPPTQRPGSRASGEFDDQTPEIQDSEDEDEDDTVESIGEILVASKSAASPSKAPPLSQLPTVHHTVLHDTGSIPMSNEFKEHFAITEVAKSDPIHTLSDLSSEI